MGDLTKALDTFVTTLLTQVGIVAKSNYERAQVKDLYPDGQLHVELFSLLDHCIQIKAALERCKNVRV